LQERRFDPISGAADNALKPGLEEILMNAVTEMPDPLIFTDSAAGKVKQLIEEEGNTELKLRVFVTGGGC
jgi:hypothetical protein